MARQDQLQKATKKDEDVRRRVRFFGHILQQQPSKDLEGKRKRGWSKTTWQCGQQCWNEVCAAHKTRVDGE